jgi:hypothetical protein
VLAGIPDAGLLFQIIRSCVHEYADAPHALGLLRARPRAATPPPRRRALACHVTLRLGINHAMEGLYHAFIARSVTNCQSVEVWR